MQELKQVLAESRLALNKISQVVLGENAPAESLERPLPGQFLSLAIQNRARNMLWIFAMLRLRNLKDMVWE